MLLWNNYVVPQWTYRKVRSAHWDRFSHPDHAARIRRIGLPDDLVVGPGQGREDRGPPVRRAGDGLTRRKVLVLSAGAITAGRGRRRAGPMPHRAAEDGEIHGISGFGDLKYPRDFRHFDYVDPDAPKGGVFSQIGPSRQYNQNFLTFNSLNSYILRGDAAQGMELTFATLMTSAADEPDAMYGLVARAVRISPDGLVYRFALRPEARFHDGTRLTAQDAAFSLNLLKEKGHPIIQQRLREMAGAEAVDDQTLVVRFVEKRARDVPLFVAGLPIFSRAYYATRNFEESSLETPLGSGPYKVGSFEAGRYIEYQRVADWWGAALPVSVGLNNFDTLRYEYYRDREVGFEGFTAKSYLFREEFTSRTWATRYDFPAMRDGRVRRDDLPDDTPSGAQGWFINLRRPKFANSAAPPRLELRLRFRMDQQDHHVRVVSADPVGVPEFRHDGEGAAEPAGARAAGAVAGPGAGPGVRRAVRAAGFRRLRPGPSAAAQGHPDSRAMPDFPSRAASGSTPRASRSPSSS